MQELTFEQVEVVSGGVNNAPKGATIQDPRKTIENELKEILNKP
ncbi:hypothetical protein GCM10010919_31270 [Alishewanella longhuensis]|uniref:Bacteriocin n=1 Tax=Alishewanella longhuensis TaxID=1091037 RepID=A0ABQ3L1X5_9ALTE|nr:hypothetical protein [Alishewanella longhuensis]GHG76425.1 hypothetical protein GCM10010919_31270 [Alishewanella longhuensis]